jgi:hypothetical protein
VQVGNVGFGLLDGGGGNVAYSVRGRNAMWAVRRMWDVYALVVFFGMIGRTCEALECRCSHVCESTTYML